ncbi:hypothetical protein ACIOHS_14530 [Streptomyces sp. NPDC088253]|uniref:hypothetical protein n=1 Tax=Streptomyces sp. NPDC088253 TaxID=3365846 RepID=UPI0038305DE7
MTRLPDATEGVEALGVLSRLRMELHDCLYARSDALFELNDAGTERCTPRWTAADASPRGCAAC